MRKLQGPRADRRAAGLFLCDGHTLLREALETGAAPVTVVCAEGADLPPLPPDTRVLETPERLLRSVSPAVTPQGVVFTCRLPRTAPAAPPVSGRHLLLDRVQDPGNVGSILRSAAAFGADSVILGPGCADPFAPKTVRAGMGACFRQRVWETDDPAALLAGVRLPVYAAARRAGALSLASAAFPPDMVLLLGNEGEGLSRALLARADGAVWIPLRPGCDSLGVAAAAAIFLHSLSINSEQITVNR
ncbi:MAG: RNA methyltransferase [Oscillospiraceae bacterium]|jgi:TrmH family RNA methyltransferase|nr:RNA methyltransferase [Oscillospiraceae bacterium]